jgi:RNA polymerase sigma-70 factor (ECF subfamily)
MTWLINIVRNKAIDTLRAGKTERSMTLALDDDVLQVADHEGGQPEHLLNQSLTRLKIDACMADLVGHERQALALAYYRGMVHTEIAQALNAPLGTAKAWVRRGLEKLRRCLESDGVQSA